MYKIGKMPQRLVFNQKRFIFCINLAFNVIYHNNMHIIIINPGINN